MLWHREPKALPEPNRVTFITFSPAVALHLWHRGNVMEFPVIFHQWQKLWVALYAAEWGLGVAGIERWDWRWPLFPLDSMSLPLTSRPFLSGPDLQPSVSGSMAKLMLFSGPATVIMSLHFKEQSCPVSQEIFLWDEMIRTALTRSRTIIAWHQQTALREKTMKSFIFREWLTVNNANQPPWPFATIFFFLHIN